MSPAATLAVGAGRDQAVGRRSQPTRRRTALHRASPALQHLLRMTDDTGILQHACYSVPDPRSGYTTDDNARALIAALRWAGTPADPLWLRLASRYMAFLLRSREGAGRFHNFYDYTRQALAETPSDDTLGQVVWALGEVLTRAPEPGMVQLAVNLLEDARPALTPALSVRGKAYALFGLAPVAGLLQEAPAAWWSLAVAGHTPEGRQGEDGAARLRRRLRWVIPVLRSLADSLVAAYSRHSSRRWRWFEDELTYANAALPKALWMAYQVTGDGAFRQVAEAALGFLTERHFRHGYLKLVGNQGWARRGHRPAEFDEQPVDAGLLVQAYCAAHRATGQAEYLELARASFAWFTGQNCHGLSLLCAETGGCYDGLTRPGFNANQGAESVLSFLLAEDSLLEAQSQAANGASCTPGRSVV